MIYVATDQFDQAVYFDLRKAEHPRRSGGAEQILYGLLGNGVSEVPVTIRSWRDWTDVDFGKGDLFRFVEERDIRRILTRVVREMELH